MPVIERTSAIIGALNTALQCDSHALATHLGLRRQFIYNVGHDNPDRPRGENREPVETAADDPRYVRLNALCTLHGITGLFEAVDAALQSKSGQPTQADYHEAYRAWQKFEDTLSHEGADVSVLDDPEVARLSMELGNRLRELQNS